MSMLMECWPDDPADIGLESVLKTISPLFEQRLYPAGAVLARQGDPAACIFFIEEGSIKVFHTRVGHESADSDEEEEEEEGVSLSPARVASLSRTASCGDLTSCWPPAVCGGGCSGSEQAASPQAPGQHAEDNVLRHCQGVAPRLGSQVSRMGAEILECLMPPLSGLRKAPRAGKLRTAAIAGGMRAVRACCWPSAAPVPSSERSRFTKRAWRPSGRRASRRWRRSRYWCSTTRTSRTSSPSGPRPRQTFAQVGDSIQRLLAERQWEGCRQALNPKTLNPS